VRAAEFLDANANPELLEDTLVLAWPRAHAHAGIGAGARPRAPGPPGGRQPAGDPR